MIKQTTQSFAGYGGSFTVPEGAEAKPMENELTTSPHGPLKELLDDWSKAIGLKIVRVGEERACKWGDKYLVFRFDNAAAILLRRVDGEYDEYWNAEPETLDDQYSETREARVYFGLDALEDYLKDKEENRKKIADYAEALERVKYEELKRKYEK